jgi:hypothetical protein
MMIATINVELIDCVFFKIYSIISAVNFVRHIIIQHLDAILLALLLVVQVLPFYNYQ